jgi:hypothetical protein
MHGPTTSPTPTLTPGRPHPRTRYDALLNEARRGLNPTAAAAAARFREEDLRGLVDAIHRREAQLEKLKRQLLRRQREQGGDGRVEERLAGRLSLLSEIRGISGLSLYDDGERR